jgi:glycosyltransferase involved in cell wall biosynthesis
VKLLLVNYEYPPLGGGAATATRALARALNRLGVEVHVLTSSGPGLPGNETEDGFRVERLWTGRRHRDRCSLVEMALFLTSASLRFPSLLWSGGFDGAVLFFGLPCGLLGLPLKHLFGIPYIISLRGGDVPGTEPSLNGLHALLRPLRRHLYRCAAAVAATSEGLRQRSLAADPLPVTVIPNGVDRVQDPGGPSGAQTRILFVGRLAEQKNVALLLHAFAAISRKEAHLQIAGDGPLRDSLEILADDLQLSGRVTFSGWLDRSEMPGLYRRSTLLILPSHYEGMSNAVLEAMAAGLPVIATAVEGIGELIADGQTGIIVPPGDAPALARAMDRLLDDATLREQLGTRAREHVERCFSWDAAAQAYLRLLPLPQPEFNYAGNHR